MGFSPVIPPAPAKNLEEREIVNSLLVSDRSTGFWTSDRQPFPYLLVKYE
jgi:hypothetical protein